MVVQKRKLKLHVSPKSKLIRSAIKTTPFVIVISPGMLIVIRQSSSWVCNEFLKLYYSTSPHQLTVAVTNTKCRPIQLSRIFYNKIPQYKLCIYRVGQKSKPDTFCNNFVNCHPMFTIFGTYMYTLQEICNRRMYS